MKKISIVLTALMLMFLIGCVGETTTQDQTGTELIGEINMGMLMVPNDAVLAMQMGLFDEKFGDLGYSVNYPVFDSGTSANQALFAETVEFATMGNINGLSALGSNLDAELIWIHETLGSIEGLAVRASLNLETPEDLAGMTIATPFSSTAHYVLLNVLEEAGIEDSVSIQNMTTSQIIASWTNGTIDAAYTWQPSLGTLLSNGGEILVDSDDMIQKGYMTANVCLARQSWAEAHPELVQAYIECLVEAYNYLQTNRTEAVALMAQALEISSAEVEEQIQGSNWTSLEDWQGETFLNGYIDTMYDQTIFMEEQDLVSRTISREEVVTFLNNSYALGINEEQ